MTYDLRWTGRFLFTFVSSGSREGGVIVFPEAFDSTAEVSQSRIGLHVLAFAKGWACSLISQLRPGDKRTTAAFPYGLAVGHLFTGRYRTPAGSVFGLDSFTLSVGVVKKDELMELATDLTAAFCLQCVLVRDDASGRVYLVDGKRSHETHQSCDTGTDR